MQNSQTPNRLTEREQQQRNWGQIIRLWLLLYVACIMRGRIVAWYYGADNVVHRKGSHFLVKGGVGLLPVPQDGQTIINFIGEIIPFLTLTLPLVVFAPSLTNGAHFVWTVVQAVMSSGKKTAKVGGEVVARDAMSPEAKRELDRKRWMIHGAGLLMFVWFSSLVVAFKFPETLGWTLALMVSSIFMFKYAISLISSLSSEEREEVWLADVVCIVILSLPKTILQDKLLRQTLHPLIDELEGQQEQKKPRENSPSPWGTND